MSSKQMNRVQNIRIETYKYECNHIRLVLADLTCTLFFYKNKSLDLSKKIKNKLRPKLDILSHRVPRDNKVPRLAILKIIRKKHQNRAWLSLVLYCM